MGEIGDVLELLHGPRARRYATVRGVLRNTSSPRLRGQARLRLGDRPHAMGLTVQRMFPPEEPEPDEVESAIRFWSEPPSLLREEVDSNSPERVSHVMVASGGRWWAYSEQTGAITNEPGDEHGDVAAAYGDLLWRSLLDPADWIPALTFEPCGDTETIGRAAVLVAAKARTELARSLPVRAPAGRRSRRLRAGRRPRARHRAASPRRWTARSSGRASSRSSSSTRSCRRACSSSSLRRVSRSARASVGCPSG